MHSPRSLVRPPSPYCWAVPPKVPPTSCTPADHGEPVALTSWGISCRRMAMVVRSPICRERSVCGGSVLRAPTCLLILPVSALGSWLDTIWLIEIQQRLEQTRNHPQEANHPGWRGKDCVNTGAV